MLTLLATVLSDQRVGFCVHVRTQIMIFQWCVAFGINLHFSFVRERTPANKQLSFGKEKKSLIDSWNQFLASLNSTFIAYYEARKVNTQVA